jgi:DNA polymerase III delta subunit
MLQVFFGTDRTAVYDAAKAASEARGVIPTNLDETNYETGAVASLIGAISLFGGMECFIIDTPSSSEEFYTEVSQSLADMAASSNLFIIIEGALLTDPKKKYTKHAEVIEEFQASKEERFNVFLIAEALAKKDKKQMWVLLQTARNLGIRDEETLGIVWWQLKALRLAKLTKSPEDAGMKEYPYKKATQSLRNFKDGEVEQLSRSLLELYHLGHQGKRELDLAFEEWVLKM